MGGCPTAPPLSPVFPVCHQQAVEQKVQEQGQEEAPRGREDVCGRARRSPQTSVPLGHGGASGLSQLVNEQPPACGPGVTETAEVPRAHTSPVIFSVAEQLRRRKGEGEKIGGNSRKSKVTFCGWGWWLPERFRDMAVRTGIVEGAVQSQFFLPFLAEPAKFRGSFSFLKQKKIKRSFWLQPSHMAQSGCPCDRAESPRPRGGRALCPGRRFSVRLAPSHASRRRLGLPPARPRPKSACFRKKLTREESTPDELNSGHFPPFFRGVIPAKNCTFPGSETLSVSRPVSQKAVTWTAQPVLPVAWGQAPHRGGASVSPAVKWDNNT